MAFSLWQCWTLVLACAGAASAQTGTWAALTSMRPVSALVVGGDGVVHGATPGGVLSYDPGSLTYSRLTRVDGLAGNRVLSVSLDPSGDLWFGTDGAGLSRFRPSASRFDPPVRAFDGLRINALVPLKDRLFIGTDVGISVFLPARGRVKETYRQLAVFPGTPRCAPWRATMAGCGRPRRRGLPGRSWDWRISRIPTAGCPAV